MAEIEEFNEFLEEFEEELMDEFEEEMEDEMEDYYYLNGTPLFSYINLYVINGIRFYSDCCPMQMMNCETRTDDEGEMATLTFFPATREGNDNLLAIRQQDDDSLLITDVQGEEFILTF